MQKLYKGAHTLFETNDISELLKVYEKDWLIKNSNHIDIDMKHYYESDLDWGLFQSIFHCMSTENQTKR